MSNCYICGTILSTPQKNVCHLCNDMDNHIATLIADAMENSLIAGRLQAYLKTKLFFLEEINKRNQNGRDNKCQDSPTV